MNPFLSNCMVLAIATAFISVTSVHSVCPSYTHKTVITGNSEDIPLGFFIYTQSNGGIYISPTKTFLPQRIPTTQLDMAISLQISDDGDWIIFRDKKTDKSFLIRRDGQGRTELPIKAQTDGSIVNPKTVGFVRNSPRGNEVFYVYNKKTVLGLKVQFSETGATFSEERTIINFNGTYHFIECYEGVVLKIVKDQVFGRIDLTSPAIGRNGFVTIPDNGLGTATGANVFKWKNDTQQNLWGCGHAMSPDGKYCVSNSSQVGSKECVPNAANRLDHKGFYITPFFRQDHEPVTTNEQIDVYGVSINWVPEQYRFGTWSEMNFDTWSFAPNNSDYVIGCQFGDKSPVMGIWLVKWSTNTWYFLSSQQKNTELRNPVMYFGKTPDKLPGQEDTSGTVQIPVNSRGYKIVYPNGSETFKIGDTIKIQVYSPDNANADLSVLLGKYKFRVPGLTNTIDPKVTTTITMVIPPEFIYEQYDQTGTVIKTPMSMVSNEVKIRIFDYKDQTIYDDSDGYFSIVPGPNNVKTRLRDVPAGLHSTAQIALGPRFKTPNGAVSCKVFDLNGKLLFDKELSPDNHSSGIMVPQAGQKLVYVRFGY